MGATNLVINTLTPLLKRKLNFIVRGSGVEKWLKLTYHGYEASIYINGTTISFYDNLDLRISNRIYKIDDLKQIAPIWAERINMLL